MIRRSFSQAFRIRTGEPGPSWRMAQALASRVFGWLICSASNRWDFPRGLLIPGANRRVSRPGGPGLSAFATTVNQLSATGLTYDASGNVLDDTAQFLHLERRKRNQDRRRRHLHLRRRRQPPPEIQRQNLLVRRGHRNPRRIRRHRQHHRRIRLFRRQAHRPSRQSAATHLLLRARISRQLAPDLHLGQRRSATTPTSIPSAASARHQHVRAKLQIRRQRTRHRNQQRRLRRPVLLLPFGRWHSPTGPPFPSQCRTQTSRIRRP